MKCLVLISLTAFLLSTTDLQIVYAHPHSVKHRIIKQNLPAKKHFDLGERHYKLGRYEQAEEEYKKAIELDPNYIEAYYGLAWSQERLDKDGDAIETWSKVIRVKPDLEVRQKAYINISSIYELSGQTEKAIETYRDLIEVEKQILSIDPNAYATPDVTAKRIAELLEKSKRWAEAIEAHKLAISLDKEAKFWFEEYYLIGKNYERLNRLTDGIESYKESVKLQPKYPDSSFALGMAYVRVGDKNSALKQYEVLKALDLSMAAKLREAIQD